MRTAEDDQPEPTSVKEALLGPKQEKRQQALQEEFEAMREMNVYKLIRRLDVPAGRHLLKGKPVFKWKHNKNSNIQQYKARWVAKGFLQVFRVNFDKMAAPTAHLESVQVLLHIRATKSWGKQQYDVKTAFLCALLDKPVYMEQPPGSEEKDPKGWVWELQKGLYRLKQGGCAWNLALNAALSAWGFKHVPVERCLYHQTTESGTIIVLGHIDNFLSIGSSEAAHNKVKEELCLK